MVESLHQKTYRFETIIKEKLNPNYFFTKSYVRTAEVYYLGKEQEDCELQILVIDYIFSDEDNAQGKLIRQISYLFDELVITINKEGSITKIINLTELRLRWAQMQIKLSTKHKGQLIEDYFSQISKLLENEESLISFFESYKMFGLLFNGLWDSFDRKKQRESPDGFIEITEPEIQEKRKTLIISGEKLENAGVEIFRGLYKFYEGNFEEGFIEIKKNNYHLKHSLLWVG